MNSRLYRGMRSILDALLLFSLDWVDSNKRRYWNAARWDARTFRFRAHATVPAIELAELVSKITAEPLEVLMPAAVQDLGGVGNPRYYYTLGALAGALKPEKVLEFGTYLGVGTLAFALNTPPQCQIFTVDLPVETGSSQLTGLGATDQCLVSQSRQRVGSAFKDHPLQDKIIQIRVDSRQLDVREYIDEANLILVDGGHSSELIRKDSENALAVLSSPGLVLWDDYFWLYPDVVRYLDDLSSRMRLVRIEDTNIVVCARGIEL